MKKLIVLIVVSVLLLGGIVTYDSLVTSNILSTLALGQMDNTTTDIMRTYQNIKQFSYTCVTGVWFVFVVMLYWTEITKYVNSFKGYFKKG